MTEKMLIYKEENGEIPQEVVSAWQDFAVNYATEHGLGTAPDPSRWEVPCIVPGAFPSVGLLLYQWGNENGNCGKIVVQPGYKDIMRMQEKIGVLEGKTEETDYAGGMAAVLHRHPKLVFQGDRFVGSVIEEVSNDQGTVYRVREHDPESGIIRSNIYASVDFGEKVASLFGNPTGMSVAVQYTREAEIELANRAGYSERIAGKNLEDYLEQVDFSMIDPNNIDPTNFAGEEVFYTVRTGKQELFTGLSKVPLFLGLEGEDNLEQYSVTVPPALERNIGPEYRHLEKLEQGDLSQSIKSWHWIIAGDETAASGEISGMPHIDERGSIDAGDIFYTVNAETEDPLYLEHMRTKVLEGH